MPSLPSTLAWGDGQFANAALDELGDRACALGFVVSEATPHVVPFLVELAGDHTVRNRADVLAPLARIHSPRQWESAAAVPSGRDAATYQGKTGWEAAGRNAVAEDPGVFRRLVEDPDPGVAGAASDLVSALA
ncbi:MULTISPECIES: hypothetical protein [Streptomyces]|uniref:HEAT repeat domain-containing protein n=1 Tax=Streptomyces fimbriatus TaxID=68197 RepID=A0ABW0DIZ1_STRFI